MLPVEGKSVYGLNKYQVFLSFHSTWHAFLCVKPICLEACDIFFFPTFLRFSSISGYAAAHMDQLVDCFNFFTMNANS